MNAEPTIRDVLGALNAFSTRVDERFERVETTLDTVAVEVVGLRGDMDTVVLEVVGLRGDMDNVQERLGRVETKLDDGFGRLDEFVTELGRHNLEILANRSANIRHEDRLEALEKIA